MSAMSDERVSGAVKSEVIDDSLGRGSSGIDDDERVVEGGEGAANCRLEEWIVRATEQKGSCVRGLVQGFGQVDAEDFISDGVVDPAFFD